MKATHAKTIRLALLSAFAVFHGIVIAVAPNPETPVGGWLKPIMQPYLNAFEFGSLWNFFSPNPGQALYLDWEIFDESGARIGRGQVPEFEPSFFFRERHNRRMTSARYIGMEKGRVVSTWGPYLCQNEAKAHAIQFWVAIFPWLEMKEVRDGKKNIRDSSLMDRKEFALHVCEKKQND